MLGVYLLMVVGLLFIHWGYVIPRVKSKKDNHDWEYEGYRELFFVGGTALCIIPPAYVLLTALIYVYKKGVENVEKNNSSPK